MNHYLLLAFAVLLLHVLWNLWVVLGWLFTYGRTRLRWFHIASVLYSIVVMPTSWPCPLTVAERYFQHLAGLQSFADPFVIHYLRMMVSPNLPKAFVIVAAEVICVAILLQYAVTHRRRYAAGRNVPRAPVASQSKAGEVRD